MQMGQVSRIPLPTASQNITLPSYREYVLLLDHLSSGPITATHIKNTTHQDKVLFRVLFFVQKGGLPLLIRFYITPYASRKNE